MNIENKKSLLFISTNEWVPFGGSEVLWSQAALSLYNHGHHVSFSVKKFDYIPQEVQKLFEKGISGFLRTAPRLEGGSRYINRLLPARYQYQPTNKIYQFIEDTKPNLVVLSMGDYICSFAMEISNFLIQHKIPYCNVIQLANPYSYVYDSIYENVKSLYFRAVKNFFVSTQNREIVEKQLSARLTNATITRNPFPFNRDRKVVYPDVEDGYQLASVARLEPVHKGQDLVMEVLSDKKWKERSLRFNLYGEGSGSIYLKNLVNYYGLKNVTFKGFEKNKEKIWSENHAAIIPSRMEGQALSLLEALSYGRMSIVTDVGDANELIEDGVNGYLVKFPYPELVDEALERAWDQREKWKRMGELARAKIFSLQKEDPIEAFCKHLVSI